MIEDKELRDLFRIESAEHISALENGFLRLEKEPENHALLEEVFREAHSLKGAARMLGLTDIQSMAHSMEDILGSAAKGKAALTSEAIDVFYKELDTVKRLVNGELKESQEFGVGSPEPEAIREKTEDKIPDSQKASPHAFKIETVRVDTKRLDELMTQAGELSVTKGRIAQRLAETEEIIRLYEEIISYIAHSTSKQQNTKCDTQKVSFFEQLGNLLHKLKKDVAEDSARLEFITDELEDGIYKIRLLPLSTVFGLFPRMVRDMAKEKSKDVELIIEGGDTTADKRIIEDMKDPLMHLIRNAVDHGIETPEEREKTGKPRTGSIWLRANRTATNIVIDVKDDGKGLDIDTIRETALKRKICAKEELAVMTRSQIHSLILVSGFSTSSFVTDVSGRGVGLDVVRANVEGLKGNILIDSTVGRGCTFTIQLPVTLATLRVLIVEAKGIKCAVPVEHVHFSRFISKDEIFTIEGRETFVFDDKPVSVVKLSDLLEIRTSSIVHRTSKKQITKYEPCIILSVGGDKLGITVDELLDEQEIVLKPQSRILKRVRNVSGSTILGTGEVCAVLNPQDLLKSLRKREALPSVERPVEEMKREKVILLAEDSITTRTQERRILTGAGYEVIEAVDGEDAFNKLVSRSFDAVVTDILMPNMDGLALTRKIRGDKKYSELPVILVTSLASDEDRKKGLEAGANAYIAKPAFDQQLLLETLKRLI